MNKVLQVLCLMVFLQFGAQPALAVEPMTPLQSMGEQVRQWLVQTDRAEPGGIEIAPLDPRVRVQACGQPLKVDHPFASTDTVRVRCASPTWQLYLQVSIKPAKAVAASKDQPNAMTKVTLVVPKRLLTRGTIIKPEMLEEISASARPADTTLLRSLKDVQYAEVVRDLPAGEPVRSTDLRRATLVRMGQQVTMVVGEKSSFQVMVRLEALQDGAMGEQVRLKNPESGRQVAGVVTGPNQVKGL